MKKFLQIPACVLVGQWDIKHDSGLNQSARIQQQQGMTRLERGRRWIAAMNRAAMAHGLNTPYEFTILAGVDHDFTRAMETGQMGQQVFSYLFGTGALLRDDVKLQSSTPLIDTPLTEPALPAIDEAV